MSIVFKKNKQIKTKQSGYNTLRARAFALKQSGRETYRPSVISEANGNKTGNAGLYSWSRQLTNNRFGGLKEEEKKLRRV